VSEALRDLGEGLVLRRGRAADAEALAAFNADVLRPQDATEPNATMAAWTRDLFTGRHPTFTPDQATVVEHRPSGAIVSSALLISQTWSFAGVPIRVGQPELVGTHIDYRGRGLVRAQFEVLHRWSADRGHQLQAIAGIPWFYRQFGYELALARGGGPAVPISNLIPLPRQDSPAYRFRPLREEDLDFAVDLDTHACARSLMTVPRDAGLWRYELMGRSADSAIRQEMRIIESAEGDPVGLLTHAPRLSGVRFDVTGWELKPGVSWSVPS